MLKLRLQYFDHLMQRADSLEKTLMQGKIEGKRRKIWQRMKWLVDNHRLNSHEQTLGYGEGHGSLVCCTPWDCKELDMTEQQNNKN